MLGSAPHSTLRLHGGGKGNTVTGTVPTHAPEAHHAQLADQR